MIGYHLKVRSEYGIRSGLWPHGPRMDAKQSVKVHKNSSTTVIPLFRVKINRGDSSAVWLICPVSILSYGLKHIRGLGKIEGVNPVPLSSWTHPSAIVLAEIDV